MKFWLRSAVVIVFAICLAGASFAQQKKAGIVDAADLPKVVPSNYFFDDQVAPVQMRNAVAVRTSDGKVVAAGLVDSSGYSAAVAEKYQGFFITSKKVSIEGKTLAPGQYGFGFTADGKFRVMDAGASDVFLVGAQMDSTIQHAVPLKVVASGTDYRLYAGKKYVTIKIQ